MEGGYEFSLVLFSFCSRRSLWEQFNRLANAYFLFITILMIIGTYSTLYDSPSQPWSTIVVLALVVSVSMVRRCVTALLYQTNATHS
jgi:Phospholipid-translocating ATPase N-terminal